MIPFGLEQHILDVCQNVYLFGSRVYGTNTVDSDYDYVIVLKEGVTIGRDKPLAKLNAHNYHYQLYTNTEFTYKIINHDIMTLECIFNSEDNMWKSENELIKHFILNKNKLRESISTISSNSYVKAKKKLIISGDYDKKAGMKSIFHSLRILDYGIQIATYDKIVSYSNSNWIWCEIVELGKQYDTDILWEKLDARYRKLYNSLKTEFKILAPKDLEIRDVERNLDTILKKYNCYSFELKQEIEELYSK